MECRPALAPQGPNRLEPSHYPVDLLHGDEEAEGIQHFHLKRTR